MKYLVFLLLPILAACAHNPPPPIIERVEVLKRIQVPAELMQQCPPLVSLDPKALQDLLMEDLQFIEEYGICRLRHARLIDTVREVVK